MTDTSKSDLDRAITEMYQVFGDGPLGRQLFGCDCCADSQTLDRWAQTPLRQLNAEELGSYLYSAMSTIGDEEDFKHFLPRLFELAVEDALSIEFEQLGTQLSRAGWIRWPDRQGSTVRAALEELWKTVAVMEYDDFALDSIVCGLALAGMDMPVLLTAWEKASTPASKTNLTRFVEHNRASLTEKRRLSNAFWDGSPAQEVRVADWLRNAMSAY